jgi:hypothetical protein
MRGLETLLLTHIDEFLAQVVAIPVANRPDTSCGLLLRREGTRSSFTSVASTGEPASTLDDLQAKLEEGPARDAVRTGTQIDVADLAADERWPAYRREALTHAMAVPSLSTPVPVLGTSGAAVLTLYFTPGSGPAAPDRLRMQDYATTISGLISLSLRIGGYEAQVADLRAALTSRAVIDMAKGVIMAQTGCSDEDAFRVLRETSSRTNEKLRDVATQVVTAVSGHPPASKPAFRWPR